MDTPLSRRTTLKLLAGGAAAGWMGPLATEQDTTVQGGDRWAKRHNRMWLSENVWANPMEDWCLRGDGAECLHPGPGRSVHSLTHQITANKPFEMSVTINRVEAAKPDGGAGFRIGLKSEINEYRSNCFVVDGIRAGWLGDQLVLGKQAIALVDTSIDLELVAERFEIQSQNN